jgi:peptide/nickel transport system permease protein
VESGDGLLGYIAKRLLMMIPTFLGIIVVSFFVIRFAPGDPASLKFGGAAQASTGLDAQRGTEAAEREFRKKYHFDKPLVVQFGYFLKRLATFDLIRFQSRQPIWKDLSAALQITILINLVVFVLIYLCAVPTGIVSAAFPKSIADHVSTLLLFMLYSLPSFWVAELLRILVISDGWRTIGLTPPLLPILGLRSGNFEHLNVAEKFYDYAIHLVLPIVCLTYGGVAYISRQMRAGMLEVIRQDYIRTAYAKGASKARVILVHALRNSLFPIITLLANLLPFLVSGSVIIEVIFQIPGMGWLAYQAVLEREYDLVMTTLLLSAVLTLLGILLSDILYALVDPRVSFEGRR